MGYQIGIFEPHHKHLQNLESICKISSPDDNDVTVFTHEQTYNEIRDSVLESNYNWVLKKQCESFHSYFDKIEKRTEELDLLMLLTPNGKTGFSRQILEFSPDCYLVCWFLHGNKRLAGQDIPLSVLNFLMKVLNPICRVLHEDQLLSRVMNFYLLRRLVSAKLYNECDAICTEYPQVKQYISLRANTNIPFYSFPPVMHNKHSNCQTRINTDEIKIILPGSIKNKFRNYEAVFEACESIFPKYNSQVEVMFLGAPSREQDKWVIERAQKLTKRGHNISINNKAPNSINAGEIEWLPMKEFNDVLSKADILLNPVRKIEKNPPGIPNEKRGVSMATGIIHDSIRHAKPLILPDHFIINDIIEEHTLTYDSAEELGELLIQVATDREKVRQINDKAIKNAKTYSLERQRERLTHLINSVLI